MKSRNINFYNFCIFLLTIFSIDAKSEIKIVEKQSKLAEITIEGEIKYGEEDDLIKALEILKDKELLLRNNSIKLNSPGGNSDAALKIGRIIRDNGLNTYLGSKSKCSSSCVYVLIGGNQREVLGRVRVHRGTSGTTSYVENYRKYIEIQQQIYYDYIDYMNVSTHLHEAMESTPNWTIRQLTPNEIKNWNVSGTDEVFDSIWLQNIYDLTGLEEDQIRKSVYINAEFCRNQSENFRDTFWDCQRKLAMRLKLNYKKLKRNMDCDVIPIEARAPQEKCITQND
jgi:hypothetical protein